MDFKRKTNFFYFQFNKYITTFYTSNITNMSLLVPTEGLTINIDTVTTLSWKGIGDIVMGKIKNKNCDFTRSNINVYMEVIGPSRVHFATNKMILTKINLDKHIMCTTLIKRSLILSWNKWKKFLTLKGQHKNLCF